jgi:ribosomal protein S2
MFYCELNFFYKTGMLLGGYKAIDTNINVFNKFFFLGKRKSFFIVNYNRFLYNFRISLFFLYRLISLRGKILSFDDRSYIRRCLIFFLKRANQNYIVRHWIGGTLTNFKNFQIFFSQISKGFLSVKKYYDLYLYYYGLRTMQQLPSLIILTNITEENVCLQEGFRLGIPLMGLLDITTKNTNGLTFPIFSNKNTFKSLIIFYSIIGDSLLYGWLKPVSFFFYKFFKRLKKYKKKYFVEKLLNYNLYNSKLLFFFQRLLKQNFNKFLFLHCYNNYILYFFKKYKFLKFKFLLNFTIFFKIKFQKKFFENSFIFFWFIKKILKIKRRKRRKIFKKFFRYKKKKIYKIFKFFKKRVKFVFRKMFKKFLIRFLKKNSKINFVIKYNKYKNYYKKLNVSLVLKKAKYEEEHIENILEEFDELPEERKLKALKKLYETFEKIPLNYLEESSNLRKFVTKFNLYNLKSLKIITKKIRFCFKYTGIFVGKKKISKKLTNINKEIINLLKFFKNNKFLKTKFFYNTLFNQRRKNINFGQKKFLLKRKFQNKLNILTSIKND